MQYWSKFGKQQFAYLYVQCSRYVPLDHSPNVAVGGLSSRRLLSKSLRGCSDEAAFASSRYKCSVPRRTDVSILPDPFLITSSNLLPSIKAVAEGSVSYYIEHYVTSRVAKATYMVRYGVQYDKHDPTHVRRKHEVQKSPSGRKRLFGRLGVVLRRVSKATVDDFLPIHHNSCIGNGCAGRERVSKTTGTGSTRTSRPGGIDYGFPSHVLCRPRSCTRLG